MQPRKIARGLKFWIYKAEGLYYLYSEICYDFRLKINFDSDFDFYRGTDQLHGYQAAILRHFYVVFAYAKSRFSHDVSCMFLRDGGSSGPEVITLLHALTTQLTVKLKLHIDIEIEGVNRRTHGAFRFKSPHPVI